MSRKLVLVVASLLAASSAFARPQPTQIIRSAPSWDASRGADVVVTSIGFSDAVPAAGAMSSAEAVEAVRFCYQGLLSGVCPQVKKVAEESYARYVAGLHQGLHLESCAVDGATVVAKYAILDDWAGDFAVTRVIGRCVRR